MTSPVAWAPNPYALAQLLTGEHIEPLYTEDGINADQFLQNAFLSHGNHKTMESAFAVFQSLAEVNKTFTLAEALGSPYLNQAREDQYSDEQISNVLPALLRISDTVFEGHVLAKASQIFVNDVSYMDPVQGDVGDCYLISALIALAWARPELLKTRLHASGFDPSLAESFFTWKFHKDDRGATPPEPITVKGQIPMAGKLFRYARSVSRDEAWPALIEKTYVMKKRGNASLQAEVSPADYQAIARAPLNTTPPLACQSLVGGKVAGRPVGSDGGKVFSDREPLHTSSGIMSKPAMAWTKPKVNRAAEEDFWTVTGLWSNHAYAVLGVMKQGDRDYVVLRNPWGIATRPRGGYAEDPWNAGELSVTLNQKGVFAILLEMFVEHFDQIGWIENLVNA